MAEEDRKFDMNVDGRNFERVLIPQKAYEAVINKVGDIKEFKSSFKDKETGKMEEKVQRKFPLEWKIKTPGTAFDKLVTQFISAKYSKGSKQFSNSKLYDLLELAELGKEFVKANRLLESEVMAWLKEKLPDRLAQISVKTTKSLSGEEYSTVKDVITFLDVAEQINMG